MIFRVQTASDERHSYYERRFNELSAFVNPCPQQTSFFLLPTRRLSTRPLVLPVFHRIVSRLCQGPGTRPSLSLSPLPVPACAPHADGSPLSAEWKPCPLTWSQAYGDPDGGAAIAFSPGGRARLPPRHALLDLCPCTLHAAPSPGVAPSSVRWANARVFRSQLDVTSLSAPFPPTESATRSLIFL